MNREIMKVENSKSGNKINLFNKQVIFNNVINYNISNKIVLIFKICSTLLYRLIRILSIKKYVSYEWN